MEYSSATNENEILFVTKWMQLEDMLSFNMSDSRMTSLICRLWKKTRQMNQWNKTETDKNIEKKLMIARGEEGRVMGKKGEGK